MNRRHRLANEVSALLPNTITITKHTLQKVRPSAFPKGDYPHNLPEVELDLKGKITDNEGRSKDLTAEVNSYVMTQPHSNRIQLLAYPLANRLEINNQAIPPSHWKWTFGLLLTALERRFQGKSTQYIHPTLPPETVQRLQRGESR